MVGTSTMQSIFNEFPYKLLFFSYHLMIVTRDNSCITVKINLLRLGITHNTGAASKGAAMYDETDFEYKMNQQL
jgi:hypothetical protein